MGINLTLSNVLKRYNGKTALDHCSVSFSQGAVHVFMGPNGSGKSTLLRVCALLEAIDEGEIVYRSGESALAPDLSLRRRLCLVLPRVGVFNETVFKNVAYGLKVRAIDKNVLAAKVDESLHAVGLAQKENDNALTLSSGETQRLGIARALAIEPEILFLDEPTASIDEDNTRMVEDIIKNLKAARKTTVILTTHDRDQALRLADHVVMMRRGRIVEK